jgi:catechol 2,3-dioxygenase-like lactoylglutathione lyase family enzyme
MRKNIQGIDHAVILVRDLDRAQDTYSRLGFTLTPRGYHTLGSQNHCLMFGKDYVELLAVPIPHPAMQYFTDFLATGEGLAAIALATEDAKGAHAELVSAGVEADAPLDFSRPVILPEGARDAAFRIVQLAPASTPGGRTFLCQHFTRDVVWRKGYMEHALGVTGIAGIAVVSTELMQTARAYAKVLDTQPQPIAEGLRVDTGSAPIAVADESKLAARLGDAALPRLQVPSLAALFFHVADRATAANAMRRGGFKPVELTDGSFAIGAEAANGVTLVFG